MAKSIKNHPLVTHLHPEPDAQDVTLIGYIGPSNREGHVRVYRGLDFGSYIELEESAIRGTAPRDADDENSPTLITVQAGTRVTEHRRKSYTLEASFVDGDIAGTYLPSAQTKGGNCPDYPNCKTECKGRTAEWMCNTSQKGHCEGTAVTKTICTRVFCRDFDAPNDFDGPRPIRHTSSPDGCSVVDTSVSC